MSNVLDKSFIHRSNPKLAYGSINDSNYKPIPLLREVQTWVMSVKYIQPLQRHPRRKRVRLQIPHSSVTAQRKEKKETETNK